MARLWHRTVNRSSDGLARTLHEAPTATADALRLAGVLGISDACGVPTVRLSVSDPVVPTRRAPLQSRYGLHEVSGLGALNAFVAAVVLGSVLAPAAALAQSPPQNPASARRPIIDMHLHAMGAADQGPPPLAICPGEVAGEPHDPTIPWVERFIARLKTPRCDEPVWSASTDDELRDRLLAEIERLDVYAVLSGDREKVEAWYRLKPERITRGLLFNFERDSDTPADLESLYRAGAFEVLGEVTNQYAGIEPADPRFNDYWALAARLDIPVGIHIGIGPPGAAYLFPNYRVALHDPLLLEDVLVSHPRLRVYVMHSGWPMTESMIGLMYGHPQVYAGVGALQFGIPRAAYYRHLQAMVEAGFGKRILFGSDAMVWPGLLEEGIRAIEEAPFLTEDQKRDILYNNAARFLRLSQAQIDAQHGRK